MSFKRSLLFSVSLATLSFSAHAADTPPLPAAVAAPVTPATTAGGFVTKQDIPKLVRDAIMDDPTMIMDAVKKLKEQQAAEAKKKTEEAIAKNKDALFNNPSDPSLGDPNKADVTIVEFFDYHCGYCRHLLPDLAKLYKEDGKLRIVFKEFPILSDDSMLASRAALAVNNIAKDKYFDYHSALMKHEGKYTEQSLLDIAKKLGVDAQKLKTEMDKPEITAMLDKNRALGEEIGVRGTPAIVIGNEFAPGALPYEELKKMISIARTGKAPAADAKAPDAPAAPAVPTPPPPAEKQ